VYSSRDLTALARKARPGGRVLVVAQDTTGDRLALDAIHDEPAPEPVAGLEQEPHRRDGNAGSRGRLEE